MAMKPTERRSIMGGPTTAQLNAIYDALVENCGAPERARDEFLYHWPECREFRFMGALGSGGKVWARANGTIDVTCYPEDKTPERAAMIDGANADLERFTWR